MLASALFAVLLPAAFGEAVPAPVAVGSNRQLYFDRPVTGADLEGRSADELRLMRNTIFARAGRTFTDPTLRDYFAHQPWYRPVDAPAKLGALDQKNLEGIKLWERREKAFDDLRRLVPGWGEATRTRARADCGVDAHQAPRDKRDQRQLIAEANRLSWAGVPNYADGVPDPPGPRLKAVRVVCGPDIDGDGAPEAVVTLTRTSDLAPDDDPASRWSIDLTFLAARHGARWRGVVALGLNGAIPGIEGSVETEVSFVKLASGRPALAITRTTGGGGDCDCEHEVTSVATLQDGKLHQLGTFETARPCDCQLSGE